MFEVSNQMDKFGGVLIFFIFFHLLGWLYDVTAPRWIKKLNGGPSFSARRLHTSTIYYIRRPCFKFGEVPPWYEKVRIIKLHEFSQTNVTAPLIIFCPFQGKEVCICLVELSFGGGKEDLLCRIFNFFRFFLKLCSGVVKNDCISKLVLDSLVFGSCWASSLFGGFL